MAARFLFFLAVTLLVRWSSTDVIVRDINNTTVRRFASEPSLFGPHLPKDGFAGHLMKSVPVDACGVVQNVTGNGTVWVALIKRQPCTFAKKVFNVQKAGYKAAIVYNVGSDDLIPMRDDGESGPIYISSVFVGESSGRALGDIYQNFTVLLTDESHSSSDSSIFLPFAIVLPLCTVIMCCFLCVRCAVDHCKKRRLRLSKSNLKKLPVKKFKKGSEYDICAICLEEYEEGDKLRELPCAHAYHQKCIDPWLTKNKQTCPLCNKKVFPRDDDSDLENGNEENRSNENTPLLLSRSNAEANYGISTAPMNLILEEPDSDDTSPDELPPNHIESRAEVHPKPRNVSSSMMASSNGEVTASVVVKDHPTTGSSDSKDDHNPLVAGCSAEEVDNEAFGFDEEYFGNRRNQGATAAHPLSASDPVQVEVHGRKNLTDQKNSNA